MVIIQKILYERKQLPYKQLVVPRETESLESGITETQGKKAHSTCITYKVYLVLIHYITQHLIHYITGQ